MDRAGRCEPRGEARQEWEIIDEISRRIGITPASLWLLRALGRLGVRLSPRQLIDLGLRLGPKGDLFGLRRGGLSLAKLRRNPHGIRLGEHHPTGVLRKKVFHRDKRVHLDAPQIAAEVRALVREAATRRSVLPAPADRDA